MTYEIDLRGNPRQRCYCFLSIARCPVLDGLITMAIGQTAAQSPQSMHQVPSATEALPSFNWKTKLGQTSTHNPQLLQLLRISSGVQILDSMNDALYICIVGSLRISEWGVIFNLNGHFVRSDGLSGLGV